MKKNIETGTDSSTWSNDGYVTYSLWRQKGEG